jgi:hypothetical protein
MRGSRAVLVVAVVGAIGVGGLTANAQGTQSDKAKAIESAAGPLLGPGSSQPEEGTQAVRRVIEIAAEIGQDPGIAATARAKLTAAADLARSSSPLDARCIAAVHEAYTSLPPGQSYQFPAGVTSIEAARVAGRAQIDRGVVALRAGRAAESIHELLGFVLLVATPMERHQ